MKGHAKFQDDEVYPPSASALGSNAHHITGCPVVGQSQPYCACLKRLEAFETGVMTTEGDSHHDCRRAWGGPRCAAYVMKNEEAVAGKALYYINRKKLQAFNGTVIVTDRPAKLVSPAVSDVRPTSAPTQPKPATAPVAPLTASYADAINATMQTLSSPAPVVQAAPAETPTRPAMLPGESPLDYIRRIKAQGNA